MKIATIIMLAVCWFIWTPDAQGDIYVWEDEEGVMNFSNYSHPQKAKVFLEETKKPAAATAQSQPEEMAQLEEKIIQGQEEIKEKLAETNQNLVLAFERTEALVEALEERIAEADRRASEAAGYARGVADGLRAAGAERSSPPTTVYVERSDYYPVGVGFVGHRDFHGKSFFHKAHPGIIGKKSILRAVDSAHSPKFRFSSTTSIPVPRHNALPKAGFGKRHFRR
jgi:Domain of unknown function (DUF4124)